MSTRLGGAPTSLANKVATGAAGLVLFVAVLAVLAAGAGAGITSLLGGGDATPSVTATDDIPPPCSPCTKRPPLALAGSCSSHRRHPLFARVRPGGTARPGGVRRPHRRNVGACLPRHPAFLAWTSGQHIELCRP